MNMAVPPHPNSPLSRAPSLSHRREPDRTTEISRRDALATGLRSVVGLAVLPLFPVLGALGGCQNVGQNEGWEPLEPWDPSLNGPIMRAPFSTHQTNRVDPTLTRSPNGVIARQQWTRATTIASEANAMVNVQKITVHHDGMPPVALRSRSAVIDRLELIRRSHVDTRGWADIGYHYIVDPEGRVWEGRPVTLQGAHVKRHNLHNLGILVLGNFEVQRPTIAASTSLEQFLVEQMHRFRVPVSRVHTHLELAATACPGRNLQRIMVNTRSRGGMVANA